jgi:hypothetical protein
VLILLPSCCNISPRTVPAVIADWITNCARPQASSHAVLQVACPGPHVWRLCTNLHTRQAGEVEFSLALSPDTKLVGGNPSDVMGAPAVVRSASAGLQVWGSYIRLSAVGCYCNKIPS